MSDKQKSNAGNGAVSSINISVHKYTVAVNEREKNREKESSRLKTSLVSNTLKILFHEERVLSTDLEVLHPSPTVRSL